MARVVLAGPQQLLNQALRGLLIRDGEHDVVATCATTKEVLGEVMRHRPDLLLLDAGLAGTGTARPLIRAVADQAPETKIMVMADAVDVELVSEAVLGGAVGVVDKRSDVRTILRASRAALMGEGVVPRAMLPSLFQRLAASSSQPDSLDQLSRREREVLILMGQGLNNARIAAELSISRNTVRTHVQNVLAKLDMHSKVEAVSYVVQRADALAAALDEPDDQTGGGGRSS